MTDLCSTYFIKSAVKPPRSGGGYKAHLNWNFCLSSLVAVGIRYMSLTSPVEHCHSSQQNRLATRGHLPKDVFATLLRISCEAIC